MTDNQYKRRLRVLGKLAYLYDQASGAVTVLNLKKIAATLLDQTSAGDDGGAGIDDAVVTASLDFMNAIAANLSGLYSAIGNLSGAAVQAIVVAMTDAYLRTPAFYAGTDEAVAVPFAVLPTDISSPANIVAAFGVQMATDAKTLTQNGGIETYIQTIYGVELPDDLAPTYADGTYYVGTIVSPDV
jgi:hypothetical protein